MKILLSNDDGYQSAGLQLLCKTLSKLGHQVYVVAPDGQRSGFSHSVNFHKTIHIQSIDNYYGAMCAYSCSGTPCDCVKFGLHNVVPDCDLLICGPNIGENVAYDILYSGTVGAAEEGAIYGVRSIALSRWGSNDNFDACIQCFLEILPTILQYDCHDSVININVPNLPYKEIKGVKVVGQGKAIFRDYYVDEGNCNWRLEGDLHLENEIDTDAAYSSKQYVTVTPIKILQADEDDIIKLRELLK